MTPRYTDMQLDALRELANVGSGTAATALSQMLGREIGLSIPEVLALPPADAVDACGDPSDPISAVVLPVVGDFDALVLLLIPLDHAATLCSMLGVEAGTEFGDSALAEIGNILGTSYLNALASMTGLNLEPCPPSAVADLLGAIVASLLAESAGVDDLALVMDSELDVAGEPCSISFLLLPGAGGASGLLAPLGFAENAA